VNAGSSIKSAYIELIGDNDVSVLADSQTKSTTSGYYSSSSYYDRTTTTEADITSAELNASADLFIDAGRDASLIASLVNAGSNASIIAGRDIIVGGLGSNKSDFRSYRYNSTTGSSNTVVQEYDSTSLSAGGDLILRARDELEITGAAVNAGGDLIAVADYGTTYISGSDVSALGDLSVNGYDVQIIGSINNSSFDETVRKVKRGFLSKKTTTTVTSNDIQTVYASNLSGNNINVVGIGDISILDSNLAGAGSVDIEAGGDIGIGSVTTESSYYTSTKIKKSGFSFGNGGFFLGISKSTQNVTTDV
jgi:filamentous hemagglutinin